MANQTISDQPPALNDNFAHASIFHSDVLEEGQTITERDYHHWLNMELQLQGGG